MVEESNTSEIPGHQAHRLNAIAALISESAAARTTLIVEGIKAGYVLNASAIGLLALKVIPLDPNVVAWHSVFFFAGLTTTVICHFLTYLAQSKTTETYLNFLFSELQRIDRDDRTADATHAKGMHQHAMATCYARCATVAISIAMMAFALGGAWLLYASIS